MVKHEPINIAVIGTNGHVIGLDMVTGEEHWRTKLKGGNLFVGSTSGGDVTVMLRGPLVLAGCNGFLFGLLRSTGKVVWSNPLKGMGNQNVCMATDHVSVQQMHTHTVEKES